MKILLFMMILLVFIFERIDCHDNGFTLGIRDSIMIAHSFKGGVVLHILL